VLMVLKYPFSIAWVILDNNSQLDLSSFGIENPSRF